MKDTPGLCLQPNVVTNTGEKCVIAGEKNHFQIHYHQTILITLAYPKCLFPSCHSINEILSLSEIMMWKRFWKSSYWPPSWTTHVVGWNKHSAGIPSRYKSSERELNYFLKMSFSLTFSLQITCHLNFSVPIHLPCSCKHCNITLQHPWHGIFCSSISAYFTVVRQCNFAKVNSWEVQNLQRISFCQGRN